jgi:hypothetical protein
LGVARINLKMGDEIKAQAKPGEQCSEHV